MTGYLGAYPNRHPVDDACIAVHAQLNSSMGVAIYAWDPIVLTASMKQHRNLTKESVSPRTTAFLAIIQ